MEIKILAEKINRMEMPEEMQERILQKCYNEMEESNMSKKIKGKSTGKKNAVVCFFRKPAVVAASLIVCLCLTGVTGLAATGKLKGYFRDITGWNGAVIGTAYEQATEEIQLSVAEVSDGLTVAVTMVNPKIAPYAFFETFGVESYEIVDKDGKVIVKGEATGMEAVVDGKVTLYIPLDSVSIGEYRLIVSAFVGSSKADQSLVVSGVWECEFTK